MILTSAFDHMNFAKYQKAGSSSTMGSVQGAHDLSLQMADPGNAWLVPMGVLEVLDPDILDFFTAPC